MLRLLSRHASLRVGLLALPLSGCAGGQLRYEPVGFEIPPPDPGLREGYALALNRELERGRVSSLSVRQGSRLRAITRSEEVLDLPLVLTYAGLVGSGRWVRGAELDVVLDGPEGARMVTIWRTTRGDLRIGLGGAPPAPRDLPQHGDPSLWGREIAETHGLNSLESVDRPWALEELEAVVRGLEVLTPEERVRIADLVLGRAMASPRAPKSELALYDSTTLPARIDFFDLAFGQQGQGFVGSLDQAWRAPVMTVVHELGHAIADHPARAAYAVYGAAFDAYELEGDPVRKRILVAQTRAAWDAFKEVQRADPVIAAYREVRGRSRGPTSYGWTRVRESFAEAFALHKLDPDALARVLPEVAEWFERGGHLLAAEP